MKMRNYCGEAGGAWELTSKENWLGCDDSKAPQANRIEAGSWVLPTGETNLILHLGTQRNFMPFPFSLFCLFG
jgi:hypothetical protein